MKVKNLPDDIKNKSLNELTDLANNIIEKLEDKNTLEGSVEEYQKLIKLNLLIEKEFQKASKELSKSTREKIQNVLKKNEKKTK
jgi:exonuclease VII small subunit